MDAFIICLEVPVQSSNISIRYWFRLPQTWSLDNSRQSQSRRLENRFRRTISVSSNALACICVFRVTFALGLGACRFERLLKVCNDVVDMLRADRDTDQVFCNTAVILLIVAQLFVSGGPRVDCEGLGVTDAVLGCSSVYAKA